MRRQKSADAVVPFRPKPSFILNMVRKSAADSQNVSFGTHARERLEERGITDREAIKVLRTGELKGDIEPGNERGEWKCKIVAPIKGSREVGVVTVVLVDGHLFVKTVEWEDR
jgi:hypothetical protein